MPLGLKVSASICCINTAALTFSIYFNYQLY